MKFKNANVLITGGASGTGKIMGRIALEKGASTLSERLMTKWRKDAAVSIS